MKISVTAPAYNEEANIAVLYDEVSLALTSVCDFELLFIDDGSSDGTAEKIKRIASTDRRVKYIGFECNCGQSAAFAAGFEFASGDVIVTIDADLQNDPADIVKLAELCSKFDVVCGVRVKRNDSFVRRISSKIANFVRNKMTNETITDTGCSLKAFKKEVVGEFKMFTGMHRFFPTLARIAGFSVSELPVNHRERKFGKSKYNIRNRVFKSLYDLFAVQWMKRRYIRYNVKETVNIIQD